MTKITLTWQKDAEHDGPYNEVIELVSDEELQKRSLESSKPILMRKESDIHPKLTILDRAAIIIALDDCLQQLSIIKYLINEPIHASWNNLFQYETLSERFDLSTSQKRKAFVEEEYEKIPFTEKQKLQKDVCFLITTLREASHEISEKGHYSTILGVLDAVQKQNEEIGVIEEQCEINKRELKLLKSKYNKEKKDYTTAIDHAQQYIRELEIEAEDVLAYSKQELHYTDHWERTRRSQHDLKLSQEENVYTNTISKHSTKIEYENRIHHEIRSFIDENIEDLQNAINFWMTHYDEEIERRDADIMQMKMSLETLTERHRELVETYEAHKKFVIERRAVNEERRRLAEILKIQTKAAIRIQAWWRGTMVRNKLGPYKEKKPKKGTKGGKGGKGAKGRKK